MKKGYEMHTSERIRNLGKEARPPKKIVGIRVTMLCLVLTVGVYSFVNAQNQGTSPPPSDTATKFQWAQQNPILLVIAGALILLCILVAVLIKVIKSKK